MKPWRWMSVIAAVVATIPAPGAARTPASPDAVRFDPDDRAYAALRALKARAGEIENIVPDPGKAARAAAWQALYDAALLVKVGPNRLPHPLAAYALIQLAVYDQDAGNETVALAKARESLALVRPFRAAYPDIYIQAIATIGNLETNLGKPSDTVATLAEGADWYASYVATLPPAGRTKDVGMALSNIDYSYSQALLAVGEMASAAEYQKRSMDARSAAFGPNDPDTVSATYQYAITLYKAGHKDEAERYARSAVQTAIDHVDPANPAYARSLEALGLILVRVGRRSESISYFLRAAALKRKNGGTDLNFYATLTNLSDSLVQLERYAEAGAVGTEAEAGFHAKEGEKSAKIARARAFVGLADAAEGRSDDAVERMGSALEMARAIDPKEQFVGPRLLPALIVAEVELGRRDDARRLARQFAHDVRNGDPVPLTVANADLLALYAEGGNDPQARAAAARRVVTIIRSDRVLAASGELPQVERTALDLVLRVAADNGDGQLALDAMVILAGSKLAQANRLVAARITAGDPALATRLREQQDAASAFRAADTDLLKAQATGDALAAARARRDAAEAHLHAVEQALAADFPRWTKASGVELPDLHALQAGLAPGEAVLAAIPAFDGVYTLTVTRLAAIVRRTPLGRSAIVALVARLRASLPAGSFDSAAARTLYDQFFPRADAAVLRGVTSLRIVPAGPLAALPFATLLAPSSARSDATRRYLIRRFALAVSSGFGASAPVAQAGHGAERFLGIGAPTPFGDGAATAGAVRGASAYFRGPAVDHAALASLPPLPGSLIEIRRVAQDFAPDRTRLLTGDDASEARVRSMDLKPYSTVLFATHGLVSGEMEGVAEPALVLARPRAGETGDGLLTASEIAQLAFDADWVILSACNTAAGESTDAPAYSGLAQAFRYAGARTLLLSHWPVRDDAASEIVIHTIANAKAGLRRDVALQHAMLALMRSRTIAGAADPYIWAPYILVGD